MCATLLPNELQPFLKHFVYIYTSLFLVVLNGFFWLEAKLVEPGKKVLCLCELQKCLGLQVMAGTFFFFSNND